VDPFLFAHKRTGVPLFDLSIRLNTISVRDQMTRALLLAERLPQWLQAQLGVNYVQHRLLIVGGGACGTTAAVALAQRGMTVEVAERDGHLFHLQRNCVSRWLDPTQYDWPLDNWRVRRFPQQHRHRWSPFTWGADVARGIAQKWGGQLSRHLRVVPGLANRLRFRQPIEARLNPRYNPHIRLMRVEFNNPQTGQFSGFGDYAAVIWAFGHGDERCNLPNSPQFRGLPFWHTDPLESNHCGLAGQAQEGTVLVSGSGDGAVQDFLRVVTRCRSVRDIFDQLQLENANIDIHKILSAELRAERAINWSPGGDFAGPYMNELQACHEEVVQSILGTAGLQGRINALVANRPQNTVLVTRQTCFTCIYPLNRFLALLILRGVNHPSVTWRTGLEVHQVQSLNVPPAPLTALNCIGHEWRVTLHSIQGNAAAQHLDANVVLLRHGVESPEATLPATAPPLPRIPRPIPPVHLF
jgi:hypothetical protein